MQGCHKPLIFFKKKHHHSICEHNKVRYACSACLMSLWGFGEMIPLPLYSLTPLSKVTIPSWKISGSPHFVSLLSLPVVLMLPAKPSFATNASSALAMLLLYYLFLCCPLTVGFLPLCSMHSSSVILLPWLPASSFKLVVLRLEFLALL